MQIEGRVKDITARDFWAAKKRIKPYVTRTPLIYSKALSDITKANVYIKAENLQAIGAFKVRGAANKLLSISEEQKAIGVSAFSTGNHGMAVAYMANRLRIPAQICMSRYVPQVKVDAIGQWNPTIKQDWETQDEAQKYCEELQEKEGVLIIPPFDDKYILCGQGTIGLEIIEDLPEVDTIIAPLSGGGLLSGISLASKMSIPDVKVIGTCMFGGAAMVESLKVGKPIEIPEDTTFADSLLGGIGLDNKYTFDIVKDYVDEIHQIAEEEIAKGIEFVLEKHRMLIEGASATGIAYALQPGTIEEGSNVVIVTTGCGISREWLDLVLAGKTLDGR